MLPARKAPHPHHPLPGGAARVGDCAAAAVRVEPAADGDAERVAAGDAVAAALPSGCGQWAPALDPCE